MSFQEHLQHGLMPSILTADSNMFPINLTFPPFFFNISWLLDIISTLSPFFNIIISSKRSRLWLTLIANCPPFNLGWFNLNVPQLNLCSHFHAFPAIFELLLMLGLRSLNSCIHVHIEWYIICIRIVASLMWRSNRDLFLFILYKWHLSDLFSLQCWLFVLWLSHCSDGIGIRRSLCWKSAYLILRIY